MIKGIDKSIEIQDVYLLEKTGGKSGDFHRVGAGRASDMRKGKASRLSPIL
jgi:hypothetical protein